MSSKIMSILVLNYSLVMKGQEAVDGILDVARASDHPRAYEVAGQLIKHVADVADKLIDLQKKMKDLDAEEKKGPNNVTNALFVGTSAELQKLLKQQKEINNTDTDPKRHDMSVLNVLSTNAIAGSATEYQVVQTGYYRVLATAGDSTVSFNGGPAITVLQDQPLLLKGPNWSSKNCKGSL